MVNRQQIEGGGGGLIQYAIYDHPSDFPEHFVVRQWHVNDDGDITPALWCDVAKSLDAARALLPPGLLRLERLANDDPVIVEVWL
jgi:hypothetical protein